MAKRIKPPPFPPQPIPEQLRKAAQLTLIGSARVLLGTPWATLYTRGLTLGATNDIGRAVARLEGRIDG